MTKEVDTKQVVNMYKDITIKITKITTSTSEYIDLNATLFDLAGPGAEFR